MKIFKDRQYAGKILSKHLKQYKRSFPSPKGERKGMENTLVLGIPRGGVVVAKSVADQLNLPLDIIITRKIGTPNQTELALGAVDADGEVVWEEKLKQELRIKNEQLSDEVQNQLQEIKRREELYRQGKEPLNFEGKTVILVDDGMATGSTILSAISYLKRHKAKKVILAVPISSKEAFVKAAREVDQSVVLDIPDPFQAVGQFYQDFQPVSDEEVVKLLG